MDERIAIVGTRNFHPLSKVRAYVLDLPVDTVVISGAGGDVDKLAASVAHERGMTVREYPADWNTYGRAAGPIRNTDIVRDCDRLVAFWDGKSRGTNDSITKANALGKPVTIIYPDWP